MHIKNTCHKYIVKWLAYIISKLNQPLYAALIIKNQWSQAHQQLPYDPFLLLSWPKEATINLPVVQMSLRISCDCNNIAYILSVFFFCSICELFILIAT